MNVRVHCDVCQGNFETPRPILGKLVRCPFCGEMVSIAAAVAVAAEASDKPLKRTSAPFNPDEESTPWSPLSDPDAEDVIPWFVWLGAFTPVAMMAFVSFEPIAIAIAVALVALALAIATRRTWSKLSRVTGIASLTFLGMALSLAVSLYAQGSFAKIPFQRLLHGPTPTPGLDLADAEWNSVTNTDLNFGILFPGAAAKSELSEPNGAEITVYESKFPKQGATFALHTFKIPASPLNESSEMAALQRMHSVARWIFFEGDPEQSKRIFYFVHSGIEYHFSVPGKQTTIVCRAYLVLDQAYLVSVTAESFAAVKPSADKFFSSFRLLQQPNTRGPRAAEPDWKGLGRPPIPLLRPLASYRGHFQPPITLLAFSADGKALVTGSNREHVVLWNLANGHGTVIANTETFPFFAIDPRGATLAVPIQNGTTGATEIHFIKMQVPAPPLGPANTDLVCFAPNSAAVYVAIDNRASAWDPASDTKTWQRTAAKTPIACQALSGDGRLLATSAEKDLMVSLWDVTKHGADLAKWVAADQDGPYPIQIQQLVFAPDSKTLATVSLDHKVRLWRLDDVHQPKLVAFLLHEAPVTCADYSKGGNILATGDKGGVVRLWDTTTGKLTAEFRATEDNQQVRFLRFSPDDSKLAVAVEFGPLRSGVNMYEVSRLPAENGSLSVAFVITDEPPLFEKK